jgi:hypothetical protein
MLAVSVFNEYIRYLTQLNNMLQKKVVLPGLNSYYINICLLSTGLACAVFFSSRQLEQLLIRIAHTSGTLDSPVLTQAQAHCRTRSASVHQVIWFALKNQFFSLAVLDRFNQGIRIYVYSNMCFS